MFWKTDAVDSESNSASGTVEFSDTMTYDDAGRLLTGLQDEFDVTTTFTYDDGGRVASEATDVYGQTYTVSRNYDAAGRLETLTYPDGSIVARAYTDRGQLEAVTHDLDGVGGNGPLDVADFTYDDGGREATRTHGNGVQTTRGYVTGENLVEDITVVGHTSLSFDYTYDANKNVTSESRGGALSGYGFTTPSGYDDEDRLVAWERDDSNLDLSWVLSDVGDWDSYTENTTTQTRTHNAVHELTAIDAGSLTYDSRGNLTQDHAGRQFAFANSNNMLATTTRNTAPGGFDATYKYDALGRRVAKQVDDDSGQSMVVRYTIFVPTLATLPPLNNLGGQVTAEYEREDTGPWTLARTFTYGTYVDEPLTMTDYTAAGSTGAGAAETFTYHHNRTYSVSGLTDSSTDVLEVYAYSPFGLFLTFDQGVSPLPTTAIGNHYTFTGRHHDNESLFHHFRYRPYSSSTGRFAIRDILYYPNGSNQYASYFAPNAADPSGLDRTVVTNVGPIPGHNFIVVDIYDDTGDVTGQHQLHFWPASIWPLPPGGGAFYGGTITDFDVIEAPLGWYQIPGDTIESSQAEDEALLLFWQTAHDMQIEDGYPWYNPLFMNCWHATEMGQYFGMRNPPANPPLLTHPPLTDRNRDRIYRTGGWPTIGGTGGGVKYTNCFPGETLVQTPDGTKAIASIVPGDLVLSLDIVSDVISKTKVLGVHIHHGTSELLQVDLDSGGAQFLVTPRHPLYVGGHWVLPEFLSDRDVLIYVDGRVSRRSRILSRRVGKTCQTVYSIDTDSGMFLLGSGIVACGRCSDAKATASSVSSN